MSTQAATAPVTTQHNKPPALRHFLCHCQHGKDPSYSCCGLVLIGRPESSRSFRPMELCGMCQLMKAEHMPCKHCGEPLK